MSSNLTKKAADMLLQGATLLSQPCPYCSGVRVMKSGHALCTSCGSEPQKRDIPQAPQIVKRHDLKAILEEKLTSLSEELKKEQDHKKQQEILKSLNSILEALDKLGK
ncbi:MAG: hypothetical protein OXC46_07740 [Thaumarchaeota archaeon]|nr:hypothetical protein [Nitrososphaerota archaeon]